MSCREFWNEVLRITIPGSYTHRDHLDLKVDMKTTLDPETQKFIYLVKKDIRKLLTAKNPLVSIIEINQMCIRDSILPLDYYCFE